MQASPTPDFALTLRFLDEASATQMLSFWQQDVPTLVAQLDFAVRVFVAPLLDQTKVKRRGAEIVASAQLNHASGFALRQLMRKSRNAVTLREVWPRVG